MARGSNSTERPKTFALMLISALISLPAPIMIPKQIERTHILRAIEELNRGNKIPANRQSKKYDLVFEQRKYPPKYVVALAHRFADPAGRMLTGFSGGREVNNFLMSRKFEIFDRDGRKLNPDDKS